MNLGRCRTFQKIPQRDNCGPEMFAVDLIAILGLVPSRQLPPLKGVDSRRKEADRE